MAIPRLLYWDNEPFAKQLDTDGDGQIAPEEVETKLSPAVAREIVQLCDEQQDRDAVYEFFRTIAAHNRASGIFLRQTYFWRGVDQTLKDRLLREQQHAPTYSNAIFRQSPSPTVPSGILRPRINLFGVGLCETSSTPRQVAILLAKYDRQIARDPTLRQAIKIAAKDMSTFRLLADFLRRGGTIDTWPDSGRYDTHPLMIHVGMDQNPARVLFHELLHYYFDLCDSELAESHTRGGLDHAVVSPLEDRWKLVHDLDANGLAILGTWLPEIKDWSIEEARTRLENPAYLDQLIAKDAQNTAYEHLSSAHFRQVDAHLEGRYFALRENVYDLLLSEPYQINNEDKYFIIDVPMIRNALNVDLDDPSYHLSTAQKEWLNEHIAAMEQDPLLGQEVALDEAQLQDVLCIRQSNIILAVQLTRLAVRITDRLRLADLSVAFATPLYQQAAKQFIRAVAPALTPFHQQQFQVVARRAMDHSIASLHLPSKKI